MADWHGSSTGAPSSSKGATSATNTTRTGDDLPFRSRRSPILCTGGCVSSSQPLASSIGIQVLREYNGSNAADAAVAVAAALAVLEPCSTGLGGDMFALHYDSATKRVGAINGSGKCPHNLTLDVVERDCQPNPQEEFLFSPHAVTVPGAARGWEDYMKKFGSGNVSFAQVVEPAAQLAERGFPVTPITSHHWSAGMGQIRRWVNEEEETVPLSIDGRGPKPGELFRNPDMANVLRSLGKDGATEGFYKGFPGEAIVDAVRRFGGVMTMEDLESHTSSSFPEPIAVRYRDVNVWQVPPNGQGVAGLIALRGLEALEKEGLVSIGSDGEGGSRGDETGEVTATADRYHAMIEMMRLGFADARRYVACPETPQATVDGKDILDWLLDEERITKRALEVYNPRKATVRGYPDITPCTVSFQVVDSMGNASSFVNSNFMGFGTGIVPRGCGFTLQNRGYGFSLDRGHPNALGPGKRPYHTIIPGMMTHARTAEGENTVDGDGDLYATFTNMGGYMQPQGHVQAVVNLVSRNLDAQETVDEPRFCIPDGTSDGKVHLEEGVNPDVLKELEVRGHDMVSNVTGHGRSIFGRAQIIVRDRSTGVLWAGSDGRADGCAMGY